MKLEEKTKKILEYTQSLFDKEIYLAGGACRDIIMEIEPKDYDFCTSLTPEEIKAAIKGKHRAYCVGERFGTVGFFFDLNGEKIDIEITTFRKNEQYGKSRKPTVEFCDDLMTDLSRRDFTICSMALGCYDFKLYDPYNGQEDIKKGIIKCVGIAKHRFREDPLRLLRALRFATRYDFEIEKVTLARIKDMAHSLLRISKERWVMELDKILMDKNVYIGLMWLWSQDIFKFIIPELHLQWKYDQNSRYHDLELWAHTAMVVKSARDAGEPIEMIWSALLHDIGKVYCRTDKLVRIGDEDSSCTRTKSNYVFHELVGSEIADKICTYLKFSNDRREFIVDMIKHHLEKDCPLKKYDDAHKSKLAGELDGKC